MKIACAVLCFNRPDYLKQTLDSLMSAKESNSFDWWIFQDGIINDVSGHVYTEKEEHDEVTKLAKEVNFPNKRFVKQLYNLAPARLRYIIYHRIFECSDYDAVFVFEDDMIVGKDYLVLLRKMMNQFPNHIGILYTEKSVKNPQKKLSFLKEIVSARLWGHYMTRATWDKIKKDYKKYYESMCKIDYHQRRNPDHAVRENMPDEAPWVMDDVIVNRLCEKYGVLKLRPLVSRAKYIGKFGMVAFKNPGYFEENVGTQSDVLQYPEDSKLKKFYIEGSKNG